MLNVICVCLLFGSGLPLLYFTTFCFLFISYWVDKIMFLIVSRKPENIDKKVLTLYNDLGCKFDEKDYQKFRNNSPIVFNVDLW